MIPQLSLSLIASIKPALMLTSVTASAACSAPMTVILSSGNYPGMFPPSPGASGVWHAPTCPHPSPDVSRKWLGINRLELAPKLRGRFSDSWLLLAPSGNQEMRMFVCIKASQALSFWLISSNCSRKVISFLSLSPLSILRQTEPKHTLIWLVGAKNPV